MTLKLVASTPALAADTEGLLPQLIETMDAILAVVEQETVLVRAGRLTEAAPLERQKSELGQRYMTIAARIKASKSCLAAISPDQLETLRRKHDLFHALLQINLTVLATAHAVSEGIIRGVSDELARKAAPQTYGATGRPTAPPPSASQPLTLSRVL